VPPLRGVFAKPASSPDPCLSFPVSRSDEFPCQALNLFLKCLVGPSRKGFTVPVPNFVPPSLTLSSTFRRGFGTFFSFDRSPRRRTRSYSGFFYPKSRRVIQSSPLVVKIQNFSIRSYFLALCSSYQEDPESTPPCLDPGIKTMGHPSFSLFSHHKSYNFSEPVEAELPL